MQFLIDVDGVLPSLFAGAILMLIGLAIGAVVFSGVWLFVFLWRKLVMSLVPGVYGGTRPRRFAKCFSVALAVIPVVVILGQAITTFGLNLDFVPSFFRVWIFVVGGFLIAIPIVLIRDFSRRKKPESEIFDPTVSDR